MQKKEIQDNPKLHGTRFAKLEIPEFVDEILNALRKDKTTWSEDGLFRKAGGKNRIAIIRQKIDERQTIEFTKVDRDDNGDLLKLFLRQMTDPLICTEITEPWKQLRKLEKRRR